MSGRDLLKRALRAACLSTLLLLAAGCGGGPSLTPVKGQVTVNGQPLAKGSLAFKSEGKAGPGDPAGDISNGEYTIYTNQKPGAPLGKYKVVVTAQQEIDSTKPMAAKPLINPKYSDPDKTDLQLEVVASPAPGAYDLKLK